MGSNLEYHFPNNLESHTSSYLYSSIFNWLSTPKSSPILDMGCGNGNLVNNLISKGYEAYGIDSSVSGISIAKISNADNFAVLDVGGNNLPENFKYKKFKTIVSIEVIEHLYDPREFIENCKNLLDKDGELIISTPYHGYLKNLLISLLGKWDEHANPLWDGGHIKLWSKNTLTSLLKEFGFEVIAFKGCGRIPYLWKSMLIKAKLSIK